MWPPWLRFTCEAMRTWPESQSMSLPRFSEEISTSLSSGGISLLERTSMTSSQ